MGRRAVCALGGGFYAGGGVLRCVMPKSPQRLRVAVNVKKMKKNIWTLDTFYIRSSGTKSL